jgi:hypothetical protein
MVAGKTVFAYPHNTGIPGFALAEDWDEATVRGRYSKGTSVRVGDSVYSPGAAREMILRLASTECGKFDLIRTMIINIKEQQRLFAEARNNLR